MLIFLFLSIIQAQSVWKPSAGFSIECRNSSSRAFEPFFKCTENAGENLLFHFGVNEFVRCGWKINSPADLIFISRAIKQEEFLACRVPADPSSSEYIPFNIPFMGSAQGVQVTVNYRLGFVFHYELGKITGAAVYPIRDQFQLVKVGSIITIHGSTKWFSLKSFGVDSSPNDSSWEHETVIWLLIFVLLAAIAASIGVYFGYLRPRLVRTFLKSD